MAAQSPEQIHKEFNTAFNAGEIDALLALYEEGASLEGQPDNLVEGKDAIRDVLNGFLALQGDFDLQTKKIVQTGDLALLHGEWTLAGTAPDGSAVNLSGQTTEVARRQADGNWLYVIDLANDV